MFTLITDNFKMTGDLLSVDIIHKKYPENNHLLLHMKDGTVIETPIMKSSKIKLPEITEDSTIDLRE